MWAGAWCWDLYAKRFEERGFTCIVPTLRHHEPECQPPPAVLGETSLLDYAADLERRARALSSPPVVVGHSMGGLLAQMLAARGVVAGAVCMMPAPPMGILAVRRLSVALAFLRGMPQILRRKPVAAGYREARYAVFNGLPEEESRRLFRKMVFESGRAISEIGLRTYRGLVPYVDPDRASAVDEGRVTCPMLVLGAGRDRITPLPIARHVARKYDADYRELPDRSHWVLSGPGWRAVADPVADWVEQVVHRSGASGLRTDRPPPG